MVSQLDVLSLIGAVVDHLHHRNQSQVQATAGYSPERRVAEASAVDDESQNGISLESHANHGNGFAIGDW
jgi:hypothetical protein